MSDLTPPPPLAGIDPLGNGPAKRSNALLWWLVGGVVLLVVLCCGGPVITGMVVSRNAYTTMSSSPPMAAYAPAPVTAYSVAGSYAIPGGSGGEALRCLDRVWRTQSPASGVACDPASGRVWAGLVNNQAAELDLATGAFTNPQSAAAQRPCLRVGELGREQGPELVLFQYWSAMLSARLADGGVLWDYTTPGPIDDVALADLDGDGLDEVILGLGGEGAVQVLRPDGSLWWESRATGETAFVSAGDLDGDSRPEVVASTTDRGPLVFEADGSGMVAPQWLELTSLAIAFPQPVGKSSVVAFAAGLSQGNETVVGITPQGGTAWSTAVGQAGLTHGLGLVSVAKTKPYAAVTSSFAGVRVFDLETGAMIASLEPTVPGTFIEVAWAEEKTANRELLLVADGNALAAYVVNPASPGDIAAPIELPHSDGPSPSEGVRSWAG